MITNLFRTSSPVALILIPVLMGLAWISATLGAPPVYEVRQPMPLYQVVADLVRTFPTWGVALTGFLLSTYQVFQINRLIEKHEILYKNSYLPGLAYMLLIAFFPGFLTFHPIHLVNTIMLIALSKMFRLYKNPSPSALIFDSFLLVSVASLLYLPAAALILLFIIALFLLRSATWRDLLTAIAGLLIPYFLVLVYLFWTDSLERYLAPMTGRDPASFIDISWMTRYDYRISLGFLAVFFLLTVIRIRNNFYKNVTRARVYQQVIFIYLGVAMATLAVAGSDALYRFSILTVPLSMMFGYYLLAVKKAWWGELVFWIMTGLLISNHIAGVY
jgi:Family of unknown function (DUF6427)